jgi:glycosyltransferase involved in cell wall biosynthesis
MKVTIITVTFNSERTVENTIRSVLSQKYKDKEYIIIDGGSTDSTVNIINKFRKKINKIVVEKDQGVYDAINKGINLSKGSIISILHSDDIYKNAFVLSDVVKKFNYNQKNSIVIGDTSYLQKKFFFLKRYYSSSFFNHWMMRLGYSPPHPSTFIRKNVYTKYGMYNNKYKIAGDFEFFLRVLFNKRLSYILVKKCYVLMRPGGVSDRGMKSYFKTSLEILRALRENRVYSNIFLILLRFPIKLSNFLIKI